MSRCFWFLLSLPLPLLSQPHQPDMNVFADRREEFATMLETGGYAIFAASPVYPRNRDVDHEYRQESNFYYLSGFEEPESILLINPSAPRYRYVMFVRDRDPHRETWDGYRAGPIGAMEQFRADTALPISSFRSSVRSFGNSGGPLYYTIGLNSEIDEMIQGICTARWIGYNCTIIDPAALLMTMRQIKNDGDWKEGFQTAIDISAAAHREAMAAIRPGLYELEVQAVFESVFRRMGSVRNGYPCIIASGPNSCTLHYSTNTRKMEAGDLVLMDCGAEYGYYSADVTRTVPVSGTFTPEQRTIYELVLKAQEEGMTSVRPGIARHDLDSIMTDVLAEGLIGLGFIKEKRDTRFFTLHGYMHWLGLDVHDVGRFTENGQSIPMKPGMVFTVEPGIYVRLSVLDDLKGRGYSEEEVESVRKRITPYLNIGVRIEDDILVTEEGFRNLSASAPRTVSEIEALMARVQP